MTASNNIRKCKNNVSTNQSRTGTDRNSPDAKFFRNIRKKNGKCDRKTLAAINNRHLKIRTADGGHARVRELESIGIFTGWAKKPDLFER